MSINKHFIHRLSQLGALPAENAIESETFDYKAFDEILQQFQEPLPKEEALELFSYSPPINCGAFGVEWSLVHLIETLSLKDLQEIIPNAKQREVKSLIQQRLDNY